MKTWFLALATLLIPALSHAVIADKITCSLTVTNKNTGTKVEQSANFFVGRLPMSASPAPDVRMTMGIANQALNAMVDDFKVSVNVGLSYRHAMKIDSSNNVVAAAQQSCVDTQSTICPKATGPDPVGCAAATVMCVGNSQDDPFNGSPFWKPVSVVDNVPYFVQYPLTDTLTTILDGPTVPTTFEVATSCVYWGTYE